MEYSSPTDRLTAHYYISLSSGYISPFLLDRLLFMAPIMLDKGDRVRCRIVTRRQGPGKRNIHTFDYAWIHATTHEMAWSATKGWFKQSCQGCPATSDLSSHEQSTKAVGPEFAIQPQLSPAEYIHKRRERRQSPWRGSRSKDASPQRQHSRVVILPARESKCLPASGRIQQSERLPIRRPVLENLSAGRR